MTDIVERLRLTTEQMANNCSVNMTLWCEHSGAALEAASEIEILRLALSETEDNTLLSYLADIRQKSGVGIKPMLSELADAIATALSEARATGRREELDVVDKATAWDACNASFQKGRKAGMEEAARIAEKPITWTFPDGSPAMTRPRPDGTTIAAAIRAAMEKAE